MSIIGKLIGAVGAGLGTLGLGWAWNREQQGRAAPRPAPAPAPAPVRVALEIRPPAASVTKPEPAPAYRDPPGAVTNIEPPPAWEPPPAAGPYRVAIDTAERANGIPAGLLARLLYQESRYRTDIISGATRSSAGAVGIAQIVPRWHPGVDPLDPYAAIAYAGRYLAAQYRRFGSWDLALAAYNWGPGNVATNGRANWPRETRDYVAQITADVPVPVTTGGVYA